jgi:hypothetical protein
VAKIIICLVEKSQGEHNKLHCNFFFLSRFHYLQSFNVQNSMQIDVSRALLHVQSNCGQCYYFQTFFSLSIVHHSSSKLKRTLMLMIRKPKALGMGEFHLKTHLNTFASNVFLTLKTMNFL